MQNIDRLGLRSKTDCALRSRCRYNAAALGALPFAGSGLAKASADAGDAEETAMINKTFALAIAGFCLIVPALGEDAAPDTESGRYTFNKVADGVLRLDTQTGEVAVCSQHAVGWACQAAPEDRAVLENEIARLRRENAALKKDMLARGLPLPAGAAPEPLAQNGEPALRPPSDADLDQVIAFAGRVWHRFVEAIARAQKQMLNKS